MKETTALTKTDYYSINNNWQTTEHDDHQKFFAPE